MTTKRDLERRLDAVDPDHDDDRIHVVCIGGEPGRSGWYTHEEYEQVFGDLPESEFEFTIMHSDDE